MALDILFPAVCAGCKKNLHKEDRGLFLCASCLETAITYDTLLCAVCSARLPENKKTCHKDAPHLLGAATNYDNPRMKSLIWELKYARHPWAARPLGMILARYLSSLKIDLAHFSLLPVPLHPRRERERGFNQSELILEAANEILQLPVIPHAVQRITHTAPQAEISDMRLRHENIAGCFAVQHPGLIAGKHIIVIDDVATSGATLREVTSVLKNAGAKKIIGLVAAKAG